MPGGTFRAGFVVEGDVSDAIAALDRLTEAVNRLNTFLERIIGASQGVGAAAQQAGRRAQNAWGQATRSANQYANAANRARTAAGGAGGAALPPGGAVGLLGAGGAGMPPIPPAAVTAANNFANILSRVSTFASNATTRIVQLTGQVVRFGAQVVSAGMKAVTWLGHKLPTTMINLGKSVRFLSSNFLELSNAFRLTGQGITNIGRSWFFFVSLPIAAFLSRAGQAAINFDDGLVRVQKTTGLSDQALQVLRGRLRELSTVSATSHEELAKISEIIGQMAAFTGPEGAEAIAALTSTFEQLMIATNMTAEEVTTGLGKIMNAFQKDMQTSSDWVFRLANTINKLENDTAATAGEIINAMEDFAQYAHMLQMTAAEAAAMSASMVSMGMTAEEAGTALRNLSSYLIDHADRVADAMEMYDSVDDVLNAVNENALEVWMNVAEAASQAADAGQRAQALATLVQIGSRRGGRVLQSMASNIDMIRKNLRMANAEWATSTSLFYEYNKALQSSKSHIQLMKNNINDLAITVGDVLLPRLNETIEIIIPMVRYAAKWFSELNKKAQMTAIAIGAIVLIGGPALMFFGQLFHAVTLVFMTLGMLGRWIGGVIFALGHLLKASSFVFGFLLSWPGLIAAALAAMLLSFTDVGQKIAAFFGNLAKNATTWAENLAESFGEGLLGKGLRFIAKAIKVIADLIAAFFRAFSPPKEGPLSTIDKWGAGLMKVFLEGFKEADFSILEEIASTIEQILTRGVSDEDMPGALENLAKARVLLAKLIDQFNKTGIINLDLLNEATQGLGEMSDEVSELVKTWLQYNQIQEELEAIESRRKQAKAAYEDEIKLIGASNMSIQDKIAAIRAAQRARDDEVSGLDEEEDQLETQKDQYEEQLNTQKAIVTAMNEQEDIFARIAEALESLAEEAAGAGDEAGGAGWEIDEAFEEAQEKIEAAGQSIQTMIERLERGKTIAQGFFDAMAGKPPLWGGMLVGAEAWVGPETDINKYMQMYDIGLKVSEIRDSFNEFIDGIKQFTTDLKGIWDEFKIWWEKNLTPGGKETPDPNPFVEGFGESWDAADRNIRGFLGPMFDYFMESTEGYDTGVDNLKKADLNKVGENIARGLGRFFAVVTTLVLGLPLLATGAVLGIGGLLNNITLGLVNGGKKIQDWFATHDIGELLKENTIGKINTFLENAQAWYDEQGGLTGLLEKIFGPLIDAFEGAEQWWNEQGGINGIMMSIGGMIYDGLLAGIVERINKFPEWFQREIGDPIVNAVKKFFGISSPSTVMATIGEDLLQGFINGIGAKVQELLDSVEAFLTGPDGLLSKFTNLDFLEDIKTAGEGIIEGLKEGFNNAWDKFMVWVDGILAAMPDWLKKLLGINSPSKFTIPIGEGIAEGIMVGFADKILGMDNLMAGALSLDKAMGGAFSLPNLRMAVPAAGPGFGGGPLIEVHIHDPVVRDERDLDRLANLVSERISKKFYQQNQYGGAPAY